MSFAACVNDVALCWLSVDMPWIHLLALRQVVKQRGFLGLYHGIPVTMIGTVVYEGCKFGIYDLVRSYRSAVLPAEPSMAVRVEQFPSQMAIVCNLRTCAQKCCACRFLFNMLPVDFVHNHTRRLRLRGS